MTLNPSQIELAVEALKQYVSQVEAKKKPNLLQTDQFVYIIGEYNNVPPSSSMPKRILLPHSLNDPSGLEICLFTKDPKPQVKTLLEEKGVKLIIKIIPLSKIRTHYKSYERRKQLASMYDLYLADKKVFSFLYHHLGKAFMFKRGLPLPINLNKNDLKTEFQAAINATHYYTKKTKSLSVRIGRLSMPTNHLVSNALTVSKSLVGHIPRGWRNIKVLHLKTVSSVCLPIYNSLHVVATKLPEYNNDKDSQEPMDETSLDSRRPPAKRTQHVTKYSAKKIKGSRVVNSKRKSKIK